MGRLGVMTFSVGAVVLMAVTAGLAAESVPFNGYASPSLGGYAYTSTAEIISRAGEILAAIDSPQRRSVLAEDWLRFSKQTIAKDLEFQQEWLQLQRRQTTYQEQAEQLRLEAAKLQMKAEELRAENLRLEQENLLLRRELARGDQGKQPDRYSSAPSP